MTIVRWRPVNQNVERWDQFRPGMNEKDIQVSITGDMLALRGEVARTRRRRKGSPCLRRPGVGRPNDTYRGATSWRR